MKRAVQWVLVWLVSLTAAVQIAAQDPIFVRWLVADDPGDETIRVYWERSRAGELDPEEMVDLGTMLFYRGYPKDAVRLFRAALDQDPDLYEAWFRIGLVEHRDGRLRNAEQAYERCLKILTGHGWCNFYMGLLQEQTRHPKKALYHYRRAFKFAPELADPEVNPEVLYSELYVGAAILHRSREQFTDALPMPYLQPEAVAEVRSQFEVEEISYAPDELPASVADAEEPEERVMRVTVSNDDEPGATGQTGTRTGTVQPRPRPSRYRPAPMPTRPGSDRPDEGVSTPPGGTGAPGIQSVSPEASLAPLWESLIGVG